MRRAQFILAICLAALTACDSTSPEASIVGEYALTSIDGAPLPVTMTDSEGSVTAESGTMSIKENGTFTVAIVAFLSFPAFGINGRETITAAGTYTRTGSSLTFESEDVDDSTVTTIDGNKIIQTDAESTIVWTRK
jgi:hypothetical protein